MISILGIVIMIVQYAYYYYYISKDGVPERVVEFIYEVVIILFCVLVTIWASYFGQAWQRYEKQFSAKFGVADLEEDT